MELNNVLDCLSKDEVLLYNSQTASEYFRYVYYSQEFNNVMKKFDTIEKISDDEWNYLIDRLFLVTYKALAEEDSIGFTDRLIYLINKICVKVLKNEKICNECTKMIKFIDSVKYESEINDDLVQGLEMVENSRSEAELSVLLKQHREAAIFRDNQDSFIDSYKESETGFMSNQDIVNINSMDRAYFRVKELVKEY